MTGETWIFLRSAHAGEAERTGPPPSPELSDNPDMWTQLFAEIIRQRPGSRGIIARLGDAYEVHYTPELFELRLPDLLALQTMEPDIIIDRGGYRQYASLHHSPDLADVTRIYLGCGERYNPVAWSWMADVLFDVILVDSPAQRDEIAGASPNANVVVFHKPAHESIFKPIPTEKRFDICFNCHRPVAFKGCEWLAKRIPDGSRVLRIGPKDEWFAAEHDCGRLDVTFTGFIPKRDVPAWACQAMMGVVCDDGQKDSGPRVLPEFLAMDIPVLVRDIVRADLAAYVAAETGLIVDDAGPFAFQEAFEFVRSNRDTFRPRRYYDEHFTLARAATQIVRLVEEERRGK